MFSETHIFTMALKGVCGTTEFNVFPALFQSCFDLILLFGMGMFSLCYFMLEICNFHGLTAESLP